MKIDQNTMIIGGVLLAVAGGVWFYMSGPCGFHDPCPASCWFTNMVNGTTGTASDQCLPSDQAPYSKFGNPGGKLSPEQEEEQASMYAGYY